MNHWNLWIGTRLHLLADTARDRAAALWRSGDRGSFATDFAIVTTAIISIALLAVWAFTSFAEGEAGKIGTQ
jgi:hypothetical protein